MSLTVFNTLTRRKEAFRPLEEGIVRMYNCGPTVYNRQHVGNFRAFLFADTLRRWLESLGYEVRQVMNITDVGHLQDDEPGASGTARALGDLLILAALAMQALYTVLGTGQSRRHHPLGHRLGSPRASRSPAL